MIKSLLFITAISISMISNASNRVDIFHTVGGILKLVGDDNDIYLSDQMAVYLNDVKLFNADNEPVLHAFFSGLYHGDIAVIGMCANGGCLYRVIEIDKSGSFLYSKEIGFARIERAKITHDFHGRNIQLNDYKHYLKLN